jgi:hypothetical protein
MQLCILWHPSRPLFTFLEFGGPRKYPSQISAPNFTENPRGRPASEHPSSVTAKEWLRLMLRLVALGCWQGVPLSLRPLALVEGRS